jgi:hypothetical protein
MLNRIALVTGLLIVMSELIFGNVEVSVLLYICAMACMKLKWEKLFIIFIFAILNPLSYLFVHTCALQANRHLHLHNVSVYSFVLMQLIYCWIHSYLTYAHPMSRRTFTLRTTLAICMTVACLAGE